MKPHDPDASVEDEMLTAATGGISSGAAVGSTEGALFGIGTTAAVADNWEEIGSAVGSAIGSVLGDGDDADDSASSSAGETDTETDLSVDTYNQGLRGDQVDHSVDSDPSMEWASDASLME